MSDRPAPSVNVAPETILFLLIPDFSLIAFTSAIEPLRIANRLAGKQLYHWTLVSREGSPVAASSGVVLQADAAIGGMEPTAGRIPPAIVLCGGLGSEHYQDREVFGWLRRWDRRGAQLGAICTGAHVLARAGLLDGHRCTIHWENLPGFVEAFPEIQVSSDLYEIDGSRFTCSGGTAALDLLIAWLAREHGDAVVAPLLSHFGLERLRARDERQIAPVAASAATPISSAGTAPPNPSAIRRVMPVTCLIARGSIRSWYQGFPTTPAKTISAELRCSISST